MATDSFTYTVRDIYGTQTGTVTVTIEGSTTAFVSASADAVTTTKGTAVTFSPLTNDTFSTGLGPLRIKPGSLTTPSPSGTAVIAANGRDVTFTPASGFEGTVTLNYTAQSTVNSLYESTALITASVTETDTTPNFLPEDPVAVKASYGGPTYYVSAASTSGPSTNPAARGGLAQTIVAVNDGARIMCAPGAYPTMSVSPKPGQTGRILIESETPVFTSLDLSDEDGGMVGFNANSSRKTSNGSLALNNFSKPWIEGWRMGNINKAYTDPTGAVQSRWAITIRAGGRGWYVRNAMFNTHTQQVAVDGPGEIVLYQNYHYSDGRFPDYGQDDSTSDYHIFIQKNSKAWLVNNFHRGLANQMIANKQASGPIYMYGCVIDDRINRNGLGTGTIVFPGQAPDTAGINVDYTAEYWHIAYNLFVVRSATGTPIIRHSNVVETLIENNTFKRVAGKPFVLMVDLTLERSGGVLRDPKHPRKCTFRNNTIVGAGSDWQYAIGQHFLKDTAPGVRGMNVYIENNTVTGGGVIPCATWNSGFPDARNGLTGGFSSQLNNSARIGVHFGASSGFGPVKE